MGKFLDAIGDKILVNTVLILFTSVGIIPVFVTLIIICRDIIIDLERQILSSKKIIMAANIYGKIKTFAFMVSLCLIFFLSFDNFGFSIYDYRSQLMYIPLYFSTLVSIFSAYIYLSKYWTPIVTKDGE